MSVSYTSILSSQQLIPGLFSDERWKRLTIDEKKDIIYSMFHIRNWKQLDPRYRIYILQELENINASIQERIPYIIKVVENSDFTSSIRTGPNGSREFWINKEYLLEGRKRTMKLARDGTRESCEEQIDNANVELFCSICMKVNMQNKKKA